MDNDQEISRLKKEIIELRETVRTLRDTVNQLTQKIETTSASTPSVTMVKYDIAPSLDKVIEDASWGRLLNLLTREESGLTAAELARRWGRSRSRTSEVLNKLVEEGVLVKYRDGREIRFRPVQD